MKEAIACWNSIERAKVLKKGYRLVCEKKNKKIRDGQLKRATPKEVISLSERGNTVDIDNKGRVARDAREHAIGLHVSSLRGRENA